MITFVSKVHLRLAILALGAILVFAASEAIAQQSAIDRQIERAKLDVPRLREILAIAADPSRPLDKRLHDEFWGLILTRIPEAPNKIAEALRHGVVEGSYYQREFWKSMEASARARRIVKTPWLENHQFVDSKTTADYAQREYAMLAAAASGAPYVGRDGRTVVLDQASIARTISRIDSAQSRMLKLVDPSWRS